MPERMRCHFFVYPCELGIFSDNIFYGVGTEMTSFTDMREADEDIRIIVRSLAKIFLQSLSSLFGGKDCSDLGSFASDVELIGIDIDVIFF